MSQNFRESFELYSTIFLKQNEREKNEREKIRKFSDEPFTECPSCHKPELKKLVSAAAFRLKGGGWYETDFKTGSKKNVLHGTNSDSNSSGSDSKSESSSTSESSKKTETKSASKPSES